jgi:hypothetical protein
MWMNSMKFMTASRRVVAWRATGRAECGDPRSVPAELEAWFAPGGQLGEQARPDPIDPLLANPWTAVCSKAWQETRDVLEIHADPL